jgi:uncharacterized protein YhaN
MNDMTTATKAEINKAEAKLEDDLARAMELPRSKPTLHPVKPTEIAMAVENATNPDTDRATKAMEVQLNKIVEGIERDIRQCTEIKNNIELRIDDLRAALYTAQNAIDTVIRQRTRM